MPYYIYIFIFIVLAGITVWLNVKRPSWPSGMIRSKTPLLNLYARDLTQLALEDKLDPVIGRKHEIQRVIQILSRRTKNNPVLIGESGVGKTAIVEELAHAVATGNVPQPIVNKRVLQLDLSGLVAGTKYRGEFEKRLKGILDEIISSKRNIILFIDELHTLAEAGEATGAINAADILKPALARGDLQVVGASTHEDYNKYIEHDQTLERRFQPVHVDEATAQQTIDILKGIRYRYEQHHQVGITNEAIDIAVELAKHTMPTRTFPDKAIDIIDEAAAKVRLESISNPDKYKGGLYPQVTKEDIRNVVAEWKDDSDAVDAYKLKLKNNEQGDCKTKTEHNQSKQE
ncbi:AAA family ATPase [Patescibacteria group bacterium]|nr:AAA family ATPase [Patescibacteria group bacterium]MBU1889947.1 AAA family ATPase [Patescibacteria group bacterium]